jgi:eukaryotic-like serine/threonine-protein kinase
LAELARAEQARIREAEQKAEQQRQERMRSEQARQAAAVKALAEEEAKRAEKARQAELHRQTIGAMRSSFIDRPEQTVRNWNRRKTLQWLGFGSAGMFVAGLLGQEALKKGRSPTLQKRRSPTLQPFDFEIATVNAKGQENPRQRKQIQIFVEDLGNGITLKMAAIPGGRFQMGSPADEKERRDNESPQHEVTVPAFFMGQHEVTQAQYEAIMGKNSSKFNGANRPVENVSWNDAQAFCKKLSEKTGHIYRLPSEAEWEYACRAETTTPFHFGETITTDLANYQGTDNPLRSGNYGEGPKGMDRKQTIGVGSFPPNAFGLYDMHGNVWEWCEDVYHENYESAPTDGSAWNVGGEGNTRLLRGGSCFDDPGNCRSAARHRNYSVYLSQGVGFRVVAVFG